MKPDSPTIETVRNKLQGALNAVTEWIEEQDRNKRANRVQIRLEDVQDITSEFVQALRGLLMFETDGPKKTSISDIEKKAKEALERLGLIDDIYDQVEDYLLAKRLLVEAHQAAQALIPNQ